MKLVTLVVVAILAGCGRPPSARSLVRPHVTYAYGLYFTPEPRVDPAAACLELRGPHVSVATVAPDKGPAIVDKLVKFYRVDAIGRSTKVTVVTVDVEGTGARAAAESAARLTGCLARETRALVWDEVGMVLLTPEQWESQRVQAPVPQLAILGGENGKPRTFGMVRMGLPDLVLAGAPDGEHDRPATVLRRAADALIADPRLPGSRRLRVAGVELWAKMDGELLLVELGDTPTDVLRNLEAIAGPPKVDENVGLVDPKDPARQAAIQKARAKLPELRRTYNAGLRDGEQLELKVQVNVRPDAVENMWLTPLRWDEREVHGILLNDPFNHGSVKRGDELTIPDAQVLDYQIRHPDGTTEGNFTRSP